MARVYANVNENRPPEYWDYENLTINWNNQDNYEVSLYLHSPLGIIGRSRGRVVRLH